MYVSNSGSGWSNATIISDDGTNWNIGESESPSIAVDNSGKVHVVWYDNTAGAWGPDSEIMYTSNDGTGWSNATIISDDGTNWNDGQSLYAEIAVDKTGKVHVVWDDSTDGAWGVDTEIMYASNDGTGWTNATVISDDGTNWNDGISWDATIAVDNTGKVHVVWYDGTAGAWGIDTEIMYVSNSGSGWSNATVISDDGTHWNDGSSSFPTIAIDLKENVNVVWHDETDGAWGVDTEIMYSSYNGTSWSKAIVISDEHHGILWNNGTSDHPDIAIDKTDKIHVVWYDSSNGLWGADDEIMYTSYSNSEWALPCIISDDETNWNDLDSTRPSIAVDSKGNAHVVWYDDTDGAWGVDVEIMYTTFSAFTPSSGGGISLGYTFLFFMMVGIIGVIVYTKKKL